MPEYWPPPEEAAREQRRLDKWRAWMLPIAGGLTLALIALLAWMIARLG